jgi:Rhomboid family
VGGCAVTGCALVRKGQQCWRHGAPPTLSPLFCIEFVRVWATAQVGHVAHLAGALAGVLLVWLLSKLPDPDAPPTPRS